MKRIIVLSVLFALTAQAEPAPEAASGEIIIEQRTSVLFGSRGSVTQRYMRVQMKMKGSDRVLWTSPGSKWQISEGDSFITAEPRISSRAVLERGIVLQSESAEPTRRRLDGGVLGKKTEDGVTIKGEWETFGLGPTRDRPYWVERVETWYRVDQVEGQQVLRPHRRERTSQYEHRRVDYTYIETTRMHTSLFDPDSDLP